jgi:hypothetical protein
VEAQTHDPRARPEPQLTSHACGTSTTLFSYLSAAEADMSVRAIVDVYTSWQPNMRLRLPEDQYAWRSVSGHGSVLNRGLPPQRMWGAIGRNRPASSPAHP